MNDYEVSHSGKTKWLHIYNSARLNREKRGLGSVHSSDFSHIKSYLKVAMMLTATVPPSLNDSGLSKGNGNPKSNVSNWGERTKRQVYALYANLSGLCLTLFLMATWCPKETLDKSHSVLAPPSTSHPPAMLNLSLVPGARLPFPQLLIPV